MPLTTVCATLQTTNVTPRGLSLSTAIPGNITSPGLELKKMFRVAGAFVAGSVICANSPSLYFAQMASVYAIGIEKWRKPTTAFRSLSGVLYADFIVSSQFIAYASAKPEFTRRGVVVLSVPALQICRPICRRWAGRGPTRRRAARAFRAGRACLPRPVRETRGVSLESESWALMATYLLLRGAVEVSSGAARPIRPDEDDSVSVHGKQPVKGWDLTGSMVGGRLATS